MEYDVFKQYNKEIFAIFTIIDDFINDMEYLYNKKIDSIFEDVSADFFTVMLQHFTKLKEINSKIPEPTCEPSIFLNGLLNSLSEFDKIFSNMAFDFLSYKSIEKEQASLIFKDLFKIDFKAFVSCCTDFFQKYYDKFKEKRLQQSKICYLLYGEKL